MKDQPHCFAVFHLNLMFSSLPTNQREKVIDRCYMPLLELAEGGLPIGIECPSYTLREIQKLRPEWLERLNACIDARQVEFVGSGYTQLVGPLVPWPVNQMNQRLGRLDYEDLLEAPPQVALVNEMAYAQGLVDIYTQTGYKALIVDACNAAAEVLCDGEHRPVRLSGLRSEIPVIWADAVMFQKLQRLVQGDIGRSQYFAYLNQVKDSWQTAMPLYCGDAEVFGYRPKRYHYENDPRPGEWRRLKDALLEAAQKLGRAFVLPSEIVQTFDPEAPVVAYADVNQPVPVKKQPKYQITRWAVSGRDDLWLNTRCFARHRELLANKGEAEDWRDLCFKWSSDFRTHIEKGRFEQLMQAWPPLEESETAEFLKPVAEDKLAASGFEIARDTENLFLRIHTANVHMVLNLRRGLALESLAFRSGGFRPVVGTLHQGTFKDIAWSADFYSGTWVMESHQPLMRVTDLGRVYPTWYRDEHGALVLAFEIDTAFGVYEKRLYIGPGEALRWTFRFPGWHRPSGNLRLGNFTLLPESWPHDLQIGCHNGGQNFEQFELDREVMQADPVSMLISNRGGFGATSGKICVSDLHKQLWFSWQPDQCAALPILTHRKLEDKHFTRLSFSLCECDDTLKNGGRLLDFSLTLSPHEPKSAFDDASFQF